MKTLNYLGILIVLFLTLNGCNSSNKTNSKTKITIWQTESDPNARKVLNEIKEEFQNTHKNVEVNILLNSWGAQVDKLTKAIRTNTLPDIAHIQPFMTASLASIDKLESLDDLFVLLEKENGKMFPITKNIAKYYDTHYGIAYALGITSWAYNTKQCVKGFGKAKTWNDFLENAKSSKIQNSRFSIMIPGASAFFMEQLYAELLANNDGKFFDENGKPLFTSRENIETFKFLRELKNSGLLHPNWRNETYLDQFTQLAESHTSCVLVTYARASRTINEVLKRKHQQQLANDSVFAWMHQPTGPSNFDNHSVATIDCEPWVILKKEGNTKEHIQLCKDFIKTYYEKSNYIKFTSQVPIHLTPIFKAYASDTSYTKNIKHWTSWNNMTMDYLMQKDNLSVRPILMPDTTDIGKSWPFLLDLQYSNILYDNIILVLTTDEPIKEIAKSMQTEVDNFLENTK